MSDDAPPVSEACQLLAEVATALPTRTRNELARLLGHSVAMPTPQELREMRLGLLVEMVAQGEIPRTSSYDELRGQRNAAGADWPGSTGLIMHYGTWAAASRGAFDLAFGITLKRARSRTPHMWPSVPYTRKEILRALEVASEKVGQAIGQWEYQELRRVERQLASRTGTPDPRLPDLGVIRRNFGGWDAAISRVALALRT